MTDEERTELIRHLKYNRSIGADYLITNEDVDEIIQALEQQPSEDCISREAVIRLVEQYPNIIGNRCSGLIADIKHLPPVTPQLKMGRWEYVQYDNNPNIGNWHCSECRGIVITPVNPLYAYKYCPNCGCKMTNCGTKMGEEK